jgi:DNA-binding HxlR family transcriptional regulator
MDESPPAAIAADGESGSHGSRGSADGDPCANSETVSDLLTLTSKAHAMALLREFAFTDGPHRFSELEAELGISPNTLSARLAEFVETGLLTRCSYDEIPPRVEYEVTAKADDLAPVFSHLYAWAETHDLEPAE